MQRYFYNIGMGIQLPTRSSHDSIPQWHMYSRFDYSHVMNTMNDCSRTGSCTQDRYKRSTKVYAVLLSYIGTCVHRTCSRTGSTPMLELRRGKLPAQLQLNSLFTTWNLHNVTQCVAGAQFDKRLGQTLQCHCMACHSALIPSNTELHEAINYHLHLYL
jgi:hypothetical protein